MSQWIGRIAALALLLGTAPPGWAGLIGILPQLPETEFGSLTGQGIQYDATSNSFVAVGEPLETEFASGSAPLTGDAGFRIELIVDGLGNAGSGGAPHDLVLQGDIDIDGDSVVDLTNTLLTGSLLDFGYLDIPGATTDIFDFTFSVTGGDMAAMIPGGTVGVFLIAEASSFNGDFGNDFSSARVKGSIGPVAAPPTSIPAPAPLWLMLLPLPALLRAANRRAVR